MLQRIIAYIKNRLDSKKAILELNNSAYFDKSYYLENNADVNESGQDAAAHYYYHGWKEGRAPNKFFTTNDYFEANPDVGTANVNPLVHYIRYGKFEGRRFANGYEFILNKNVTIIDAVNTSVQDVTLEIVVIFHIYGAILAEEISYYLPSFPQNFDIVVTTDSDASIKKIQEFFSGKTKAKIFYKIVPNIGFDTAALLIGCSEIVRKYDVFCFFHNKTSTQNSFGHIWRRYLGRNLFGSQHVVRQICEKFRANDELGMLYPPPFSALLLNDFWDNADNKLNTEILLAKMKISHRITVHDLFPVGAMFWARTRAVLPLFNLGLSYNDFEIEKKGDGQLRHFIERAWSIVAQHEGYYTEQILAPLDTNIFYETHRPKRIALFQCLTYSKEAAYTIEKLFDVVDSVVVISNSPISQYCEILMRCHKVIIRENVGMDFGGWRDAIHYLGYEYISEYDELVLCNNSCFAPLISFQEIFYHMSREECDFWGNTKHGNFCGFREHIQSYLFVFKNSVFTSEIFKYFFAVLPNYETPEDTIKNAEGEFTHKLAQRFSYKAYIDVVNAIPPFDNMYTVPLSFLLMGSPFLKKKSFGLIHGFDAVLADYVQRLTNYPLLSFLSEKISNDIVSVDNKSFRQSPGKDNRVYKKKLPSRIIKKNSNKVRGS